MKNTALFLFSQFITSLIFSQEVDITLFKDGFLYPVDIQNAEERNPIIKKLLVK